jgi:hypothetical protein
MQNGRYDLQGRVLKTVENWRNIYSFFFITSALPAVQIVAASLRWVALCMAAIHPQFLEVMLPEDHCNVAFYVASVLLLGSSRETLAGISPAFQSLRNHNEYRPEYSPNKQAPSMTQQERPALRIGDT